MKVRTQMKTPISYYGGKQMMSRHIVPLIPKHKIYTEAFFGGGAIFFQKEQSEVEIINDLNGEVVNFYQVITTDFWKLNELVQSTLHSREQYEDAIVVYNHPKLFNPIKRAWAFWILTNQGYVSKIGSWGYDKTSSQIPRTTNNKKIAFDQSIRFRLEHATIECNDAIKVIQSRDSKDTFHYIDSPYVDTNQGHYSGYTKENFIELLETCSQLEGMFLLSHYKSDILTDFVNRNNWFCLEFDKNLSASRTGAKRKTEVLVANYPLKAS